MSHNTNVTCLEFTTGKDLVLHEPTEGKPFATVFALHNRYMGKDNEERTMPISILFSGRTLALAKKTVAKTGSRAIVTGQLDFTPSKKDDGAGFYQIRAESLTPITQKE